MMFRDFCFGMTEANSVPTVATTSVPTKVSTQLTHGKARATTATGHQTVRGDLCASTLATAYQQTTPTGTSATCHQSVICGPSTNKAGNHTFTQQPVAQHQGQQGVRSDTRQNQANDST